MYNGVAINGQGYDPPKGQNDVMSAYDERLRYEMAKAEVDLRKGQIVNQQRLQLQWGLEDIKLWYKTYMAMLGATVYKDNVGNLMFAISDERGAKISSKRLLNVKNFKSEILVSEVPEKNKVLYITWDGNENAQLFLHDLTKGISPNAFLNKLKGHGVLFTVSGRTEKKAAEALLAYSIEGANITEISACYGWCRKSDGNWHFAGEDEITMRRILNDEK